MKKAKLLSAAIAALLITGAAGVALAAAGKDDEASDTRVHLQMRGRAARGVEEEHRREAARPACGGFLV